MRQCPPSRRTAQRNHLDKPGWISTESPRLFHTPHLLHLHMMRGQLPKLIVRLLVFLSFCLPAIAETNFNQCLADVREGKHGLVGGVDTNGNPVNVSEAKGVTYELCISACGPSQEPFSWSVFSQQFSAWLLPWLALISQLPFGAKHRSDNLSSVFLTVGSPVLAAYSLAITVLNGHWIARRFSGYEYPNVRSAVRILSGLQQAPLKVTDEHGLLASLVVLPENDEWFKELAEFIEFEHTWSISSATSIAWVVVAYLFTVIDSFSNITSSINSNGQAVGSVWLWLVPIVVGWLQIAPKIESNRLTSAMNKANRLAYIATPDPSKTAPACTKSSKRAFSLTKHRPGSIVGDEECTAPIFNYARFFPWVQAVEEVASAYHCASDNAAENIAVDQSKEWESGERKKIFSPGNRRGTIDQVIDYCRPSPLERRRWTWGPGVVSRLVVASLVALILQWGTTAASIIVVWFTPTRGLGCRSGAYVIYGILSTLVWLMMVTSSVLAHYSRSHHRDLDPSRPDRSSISDSSSLAPHRRHPAMSAISIASFFSTFLRRLGKTMATLNTIWLILICVFQFSSFFDTCYCNSDVLYFGADKAYAIIETALADESLMRGAWIGAIVLALSCAFGFIGFVNLYADPPLPDPAM